MVDFTRRRSFESSEPNIPVDAGLPVGTHVFQLTVTDSAGNRSRPARIKVIIERRINRDVVNPRVVVAEPVVDADRFVRRRPDID